MIYRGYEIIEEKNKITVKGVNDFNPVHIFECGQCFRWKKQKDGSYTGIAAGRILNINHVAEGLELTNTNLWDFKEFWFDYFDLGRDYSKIKGMLSRKDDIMKSAVEFGQGMRILRQDIWEMLISFILSAQNAIPRIMKTVEEISRMYGEELLFDGVPYYTFPARGKLAGANFDVLKLCKAGFRCKFIIKSSQMVHDSLIQLDNIQGLETDAARNELMKFYGVKNKIADCVLLYSGTKYDVFPTDIWIKRVMEELYFKREANPKEIQEFAREYFGELAGFAQQYLFYYARENKIGTHKRTG